MTYNTFIETSAGQLYVATAPLTSGGYSVGNVFNVGAFDGNHSLSVSGGRITLPAGKYMLEGIPWVGSTGQIAYQWYLDSGSGFTAEGERGIIQTASDTGNGVMNQAYCRASVPRGSSYEIELRVTYTSGTVSDEGGYIIVWRTE